MDTWHFPLDSTFNDGYPYPYKMHLIVEGFDYFLPVYLEFAEIKFDTDGNSTYDKCVDVLNVK